MNFNADDRAAPLRPKLGQVGFNVFEKFEQYQSTLVQRLTRACGALDAAGIAYAVVGGQAVIAWVASVDESAIRSTQDIDLLVDREQLPHVIAALEAQDFVYGHTAGIDYLPDGAGGKVREGIHLLFAGEQVRPDHPVPAPSTSDAEVHLRAYRIIRLPALVEMKLASHRLKDRVHLQDMASVGLLRDIEPERYHPVLAERLRHLLEHPEE